jgi:exopolyphosphatase / guanosine-5'-triphosphate,3'-diphosphate pyrophosphatase
VSPAPAKVPAPARTGGSTRELAVIDLGSNTARFVLFSTTPEGGFHTLYSEKELPRLGHGTGPDGALAAEGLERGVDTLRRFAHRIDRLGRPPTIAVATSAVREAPNRETFLDQVRRSTGLRLDVLTGEQEGRYAYLGTGSAWELGDDLLVDLGGGSMQLAATHNGRLGRVASVPLGSLRLSELYLEHDPPREKELDSLRRHVRSTLRPVLPRLRVDPNRVFGIGGSVRALARVAIESRHYPIPQVHGYSLRRRELHRVGELLSRMPVDQRRAVPGLSRPRAEVVVPAAIVFEEVLRGAALDELQVSANGIREGVAVEALRAKVPAPAQALARRGAIAHARGFGRPLEHGEEVCRRVLQIFDSVAARYEWGVEERTALSVAAWLHDVGESIESWGHSRHSAYILQHAPVFGVDHRGVGLAVLAVLLHEGDDLPRGWKGDWREVIRGRDLETGRQFGALLFVAESLAGTSAAARWDPEEERLEIRTRGPLGSEASERTIAKVAGPVKDAFGWEVSWSHAR